MTQTLSMDEIKMEKGKHKMISVIVPIYNAGKLLEACVDSIRTQTYEDLEILLVDDGSTDGSLDVMRDFEKKDNRIRLVFCSHGGVSAARNRGIEESQGEFISFVDADDTIEPEMLESLYKAILRDKTEIALCGCKIISSNKKIPVEEHSYGKEQVMTGEEVLSVILRGGIGYSVCNRLIRRGFLEDVRFRIGEPKEDNWFNCELMTKKCRISVLKECYYNYIRHSKSTTVTVTSKELFRKIDQGEFERTQMIIAAYPSLEQLCQVNLAQRYIIAANDMLRLYGPFENDYFFYRRKLLQVYSYLHMTQKKHKIMGFCIRFLPHVYGLLISFGFSSGLFRKLFPKQVWDAR